MGTSITSQRILLFRMIWFSMVISTGIFCFILTLMAAKPISNEVPSLLLPMVFTALIALALSVKLPGVILKSAKERITQPVTPSVAANIFFMPFIVQAGLAEFVALIGFLVARFYGIVYYFPFWGCAMISFLIAFPTETKILNRIQNG